MSSIVAPQLVGRPHVRALGKQVVIVPIHAAREEMPTVGGIIMDLRVSAGGIAIPDEVDNFELEGTVVGLGDGFIEDCPTCYPQGRQHQFTVEIGDRCLIVPWLATSIFLDGTHFMLCLESDIVGIFTDDA